MTQVLEAKVREKERKLQELEERLQQQHDAMKKEIAQLQSYVLTTLLFD